MIGYGLHPFQPSQKFLKRYEEFSEEETTLAQFQTWCKENYDRIRELNPKRAPSAETLFKSELREDFFRNEPEKEYLSLSVAFNGPNHRLSDFSEVLMLTTPCRPHWRRYNDAIDWSEEDRVYSKQNRLVGLREGLEEIPFRQPLMVIEAMMLFLNIEEEIPNLREMLYVFWS